MAEISAQMIKELRERTGAGMADCKKALQETDGDTEKAAEFLRKKGLASAAKKAGRVASEGVVTAYIHSNSRIGVLLEVNCETDFVAKTDDFKAFCKDVAMHIAAANPLYVSEEQVDQVALEKEREIKTAQAREQGKKEDMIPRIVDGQIAKWKKEVCLLDQIWVRDPDGKKDIKSLTTELVAKLGENIKIRRFVRYELGEGLEKKKDDFAAEVARQAGL
ncbi:MAG TPA: translation elongation factor Ts [Polyangia bacterium]|jgi:elongation factor Ts|nr:translation elongation factor Ts [Polyangia bacterium]